MANLFEELNNALNTHHTPDAITRMNIGLSTIHPKINGYFYIFIRIPKFLKDKGINEDKVSNWISGTAINFTPHSRSLNVVDINALNGLQHSYVTGQTITRDISATYYDYMGSPIYKFHRAWMDSIIHPGVGLSMLNDYSLAEYAATMLVIVTKPVGGDKDTQITADHIEHVWLYPAVIPTSTDQTDALAQDITAPAEVQLSFSYRFNGFPVDEVLVPEIKDKAAQVLNSVRGNNSTSKYLSAWLNNPLIDEIANGILP
jgi:hypothetical protein